MNVRILPGLAVVFALGAAQIACAAPTSDEEPSAVTDEGSSDEKEASGPEVIGVTQQASTVAPSCVKITREWFSDIYNYWTVHSSCAGTYTVKIDVAYLPDTSCATIRLGQTVTFWKFYIGGVDAHGRGVIRC
jgi:hypothetical protein